MESGDRVYRCQFTKNLTLIGSDPSNDIVIRDSEVAPNHAQISRANGVFTLRRLDTAEIFVDGDEVEGGLELENGQRIEIGDSEILFVREHPVATRTVHFLIRKPNEPPMGFWTPKPNIVLGREKGDIILDDPLLSRVHAIIENYCEGGQFLLDARSERGTALNGVSIESRRRLRDGDLIQIGETEIEFRSNPFRSEHSHDAAKLAEQRIESLRRSPAGRRVVSDINSVEETSVVPKNPYQRYPSEPARPVSTSSGSSQVSAGGSADAPLPSRRRLDLRSGVQTGVVDTGVASTARGRSRKPSRVRAGTRPRSTPAPAAAAPPQAAAPRRSSNGPASLPKLKRRRGWGLDGESPPVTGTRRSEMDTDLHLGDTQGRGLWYVPGSSKEEAPKRSVQKPIIRVRGDEVPGESKSTGSSTNPSHRRSQPQSQPQRARVRRPVKAGPPGSEPIQPMRSSPKRRPAPRPVPPPAQRPGSAPSAAPPQAASGAPGARPNNGERWYIPDERRKPVARQRGGQGPWYVPDSGKKGGRPREEDEEPSDASRQKRGNLTEVFDGNDY